ncbi:MAG: hypothetical protein ACODAU_11425 [Myxococcota bacterium]
MELVVWSVVVAAALVAVLWWFLRPKRKHRLEHEERLPLEGDEHPGD